VRLRPDRCDGEPHGGGRAPGGILGVRASRAPAAVPARRGRPLPPPSRRRLSSWTGHPRRRHRAFGGRGLLGREEPPYRCGACHRLFAGKGREHPREEGFPRLRRAPHHLPVPCHADEALLQGGRGLSLLSLHPGSAGFIIRSGRARRDAGRRVHRPFHAAGGGQCAPGKARADFRGRLHPTNPQKYGGRPPSHSASSGPRRRAPPCGLH
jgi:hypothetical protein